MACRVQTWTSEFRTGVQGQVLTNIYICIGIWQTNFCHNFYATDVKAAKQQFVHYLAQLSVSICKCTHFACKWPNSYTLCVKNSSIYALCVNYTLYTEQKLHNSMCKLKPQLHTLRESNTTFYAKCVNSNIKYTLFV